MTLPAMTLTYFIALLFVVVFVVGALWLAVQIARLIRLPAALGNFAAAMVRTDRAGL